MTEPAIMQDGTEAWLTSSGRYYCRRYRLTPKLKRKVPELRKWVGIDYYTLDGAHIALAKRHLLELPDHDPIAALRGLRDMSVRADVGGYRSLVPRTASGSQIGGCMTPDQVTSVLSYWPACLYLAMWCATAGTVLQVSLLTVIGMLLAVVGRMFNQSRRARKEIGHELVSS